MAKLHKNDEYAAKINFASVAMLAMLSGVGKNKKRHGIANKRKTAQFRQWKHRKKVVRYGWHDCLNGGRRAAEGENQILSVLETMPDTTLYTDCFISDLKMTCAC